ncbi:MAG: 4-oxalocrotonate tautomerase family protein [Devosia nanyangense]|uniref:4-oxalocrotonate tautomerase family protein n=1 Tax=Devosia nanyangense TaxID=1228055 RepID=A0A933L1B8_9HYPH|nr:4-oxalocrotonate tautomerase family protein [Devosia nanyangense]
MPYVRVEITGGATTAQKLAIHKGMTDVLVNVLGKNPEYTFIVIEEVSSDNWGHKGTSVAELQKLAAPKPRPPRVTVGPKKAAARKPAAKKAARR